MKSILFIILMSVLAIAVGYCQGQPSQLTIKSDKQTYEDVEKQPGSLRNDLKIELHKSEDVGDVIYGSDAAVVDIKSKSGIGSAKLTLFGKQWPSSMVIRINLDMLEGFAMENGIIHFSANLRRQGRTPYWKIGEKKSSPSDGNLEITIEKQMEEIEITVPKEMLGGNPKSISFRWIDAYRY